jgi:hypothetical protein
MINKLLFISYLLTLITLPRLDCSPTQAYDNRLELIKPELYILYWSVNQTDIVLEIHAKTKGWLSFGLNKNDSKYYSDVIMAWLNEDGSGHFSGKKLTY